MSPGVTVKPVSASWAASMPLGAILGALFALFALDSVLLLGFLGQNVFLVLALAVFVPAAVGILTARVLVAGPRVSLRTLLFCFAIAAFLLMIGGEGRLFYANADWQVRDAVLRDMGTNRWPFDYWLDGRSQVLRAPLGMYLVPALLGGASQLARDWALFAHNSLVLGLLFAGGSVFFDDRRGRIVAVIIFVMFSGLDVIGNGVVQLLTGAADWDHIEHWADNHQFSAHITQIFWVPHHAFAGWTCALAYLLWRRGLAPVGIFGASIPLAALWSPLAVMGAVPFAIFAGARSLIKGAWIWCDVALSLLAVAVAMPALIYLHSGTAAVSSGPLPLQPLLYCLIMLLEVVPLVLPLLFDQAKESDRGTLVIAAACLFLMPLWAIGASTDFQMRASIMPLAIIAMMLAARALRIEHPGLKLYVGALLTLGSVTGAAELYRAARFRPSPEPHCSLVGVWTKQSNMIVPHSTYFASRSAIPTLLAPRAPVDRVVEPSAPVPCWDRRWRTSRSLSR